MPLRMGDDLDGWLRLNLLAFPGGKALQLLRQFGSPTELFAASERTLTERGRLTPGNLERIRHYAKFDTSVLQRTMDRLGVRAFALDDEGYPARLRTIADPPPLVFVRGNCEPADESAIALVGTRRASTYGRLVAERLASDLARRGVSVVSGLARGIDTAAHEGALRVGGRTLAVLGCGLDVPYPKENQVLLERIVAGRGYALSEFALGTNPEPWHFPERNRLISALSLGVIVVEAPENSGALITADYAAEHGREVMAVPGNIDSGKFAGCHRLIKEGAKLVETVEDVLEELNLVAQPKPFDAPRGPRPHLSPLENRVVGRLSLVPRHIDEVTREAELTAAQTSATLLTLEIKGLVRKLPGGMFVRTS